MVQISGGFQAQKEKLNQPQTPVPSDTYNLGIHGTEEKPTAAKTGKMLIFDFVIMDGEFKGRHVYDRLNIDNPNTTAVEIAYGDLTAISVCCGLPQWTDTVQLHGKILKAVVNKVPRNDQPEKETNEIEMYMAMDGRTAENIFDGVPASGGGVDAGAFGQPNNGQQTMQNQQPAQTMDPNGGFVQQNTGQQMGGQQPMQNNQQPDPNQGFGQQPMQQNTGQQMNGQQMGGQQMQDPNQGQQMNGQQQPVQNQQVQDPNQGAQPAQNNWTGANTQMPTEQNGAPPDWAGAAT